MEECVCCVEYIDEHQSIITRSITNCGRYICNNCLHPDRTHGFYVICCIECIQNLIEFMSHFGHIGKLVLNKQKDFYEYTCNKVKIYSGVDILEHEIKVYDELMERIRLHIDEFLIKDLLNIVIEYLISNYKIDTFFHL